MSPIVSSKDKPPFELHIRQEFAMSRHEPSGNILSILRQQTAKILAEKILAEERFFELTMDKDFGALRSDVIVMTVDEFFDRSRRKFKEGMEHAQGFRPRDWSVK